MKGINMKLIKFHFFVFFIIPHNYFAFKKGLACAFLCTVLFRHASFSNKSSSQDLLIFSE